MFQVLRIDDFGDSYVIVDAVTVGLGLVPGVLAFERVSSSETRVLLERLLRRAPSLLAQLRVHLTGERPLATSHHPTGIPYGTDACLARVLDAFGPAFVWAPENSPFERLHLLRRRAAQHGQVPFSIQRESPEQQRMDAALVKLGRAPLLHRGTRYRLSRAGAANGRDERHGFEVLSEARLLQVLRELSKAPALPHQKEALEELLAVADAQHRKTGHTDLLLLQEVRTFAAPVEASGPALTPSKLHKEAHWLEVITLDENGEVLVSVQVDVELSDRSRKMLKTNEEGFARLEHVPAGEVTVGLSKHRRAK